MAGAGSPRRLRSALTRPEAPQRMVRASRGSVRGWDLRSAWYARSHLLTKRRWQGQEHVPRTGGVIIAANHVSWVDPFTLGHFVYKAGRIPRFMAKESLFRLPVIGRIMRGADQIPVHRGERDGAAALSDAVQALRDGEAVLIYPEGTITRDPGLVADAGQDGRGPAGSDVGRSGHPGGAVGAAGDSRALAPPAPVSATHDAKCMPWTAGDAAPWRVGRAAEPGSPAGAHRRGHDEHP